jgi:predicted dehydrogenase
MRHAPLYARIAAPLADDRIGRLGMLSAHEVRVPFPRGHYYRQAESGGTLLEKDCHDFDIFNWYADADPVRVAAFGGQRVLDRDPDVLDHATVVVEYENGVKGTLELCLYAPFSQPTDRRYELRGTEGLVRSGADPGRLDVFDREGHDTLRVGDTDDEHGGADFRMWLDVLRTLAGESEPPATATDAKRAAAVAIGAERAIRENRVVEIDRHYDLQ